MRDSTQMDVDQQIERIGTDGEALARAAEAGPFDAPVPGCPEWDVEMLLRHIGDVHRWAATIVRDRPAQRLQRDFEGPADREALLAWYRDGCHVKRTRPQCTGATPRLHVGRSHR